MMTWQPAARNEWQLALRRALSGRDEPAPPPGLFGDPERFRTLLLDAGCDEVTFTAHEAPMYFGPDVEDAVAFLAGQHDMTPQAADCLRGHARDDSAAWFGTARR